MVASAGAICLGAMKDDALAQALQTKGLPGQCAVQPWQQQQKQQEQHVNGNSKPIFTARHCSWCKETACTAFLQLPESHCSHRMGCFQSLLISRLYPCAQFKPQQTKSRALNFVTVVADVHQDCHPQELKCWQLQGHCHCKMVRSLQRTP